MKLLIFVILVLISISAKAATLGQVQVATTVHPVTNYLVVILGNASNSSYRLISPSNLSLILPPSGGGGGNGIVTNGGSGTNNVLVLAVLISPTLTNSTLNGTNTGNVLRLSDLVVTNHSALGTANFTGPVTNTDTLTTAGVASFQDSILVAGSSTFFSLLSVGAQLTAQQTIIAGGLVRVPRLIATNDVTAGVVVPLLATASRPAIIGADGTITNASGTPDGTKFLRDDGVLTVPAGGVGSGLPFISRFKTNGTMTVNTNFYIQEYSGATNVTWTLPLASTCSNFTCVFKNNGVGSANLQVQCSGSDKFNGVAPLLGVPPPGAATSVYSDGISSWLIY